MQGKTILITGASRGLGLALAQHWQANNTVIGLARTRPAQHGLGAAFYNCDLANGGETVRTMKEIMRDFPKIDMLINNAAMLKTLPLGVMTEQDIARMIDINLKAPILISKCVFRRMIGARRGQIINILSMAPKLCVVGDSVYSATKAGLEAFSRVLNKEGHPFGVHVNNIGLSAFPSGMLDLIIGDHPERILHLIPHKQFAPFKEILAAIEFFQTNSTDIGGQTLYFGGVA
jgi:NAD(P)-dependent dehydrogenase (short-subunit alcohol dehydrogenase family)